MISDFFVSARRHKLRVAIAILVPLMLILALGFMARRGLSVDTNILSLLPATEQDPVIEKAVSRFTEHMSSRVLFLVGHESFEQAGAGAAELVAALEGSTWFDEVQGRFDENREQAFYKLYFPYRYQLLSRETALMLQQPEGAARLYRQAEQALYTPMSGLYSRILEEDPLLLFPDFVTGLPKPPGNLAPHDGWLVAEHEDKSYVLVSANITGNAFGRDSQKAIGSMLDQVRTRLESPPLNLRLLQTGVPFYAAYGAETAEREISLIGGLSVLGVILLFLFVFRSPAPLLLGLLPIAIGLLAALTVCFALFPSVHLVTLGFGASLIGVCIDYTFHYFCALWEEDRPNPFQALKNIFPAITMGAITSILAYLGMLVAPFPGLRQMAVFSSVGLLFAWGTVVVCFPLLNRSRQRGGLPGLGPSIAFVVAWRKLYTPLIVVPALVLTGFIYVGLNRLTVNDDIRALQKPPAVLQDQELTIRQIAGGIDASRFLLVEGSTREAVLEREESLIQKLNSLDLQQRPGFVQGISRMLPSPFSQELNHQSLQKLLLDGPDSLDSYLNRMGFEPQVIAEARARISAPFQPLTLEQWLTDDTASTMRHLWLGETGRGFASLVLLGEIRDFQILQELEDQMEGVYYVDKVADLSHLLQRYRILSGRLVMVSYFVIFLLLSWRHGLRRGLLICLPPIFAALLTLAFFGFTGHAISLFHLLALLLVLGIGIDYTIFFVESPKASIMLAITLSAITTILSFGLLALSTTPVLSGFGLTVLVGIGFALLLSPLAAWGSASGKVNG